MRLLELYRYLIKYFSNKASFISLLFYFVAAGLVWYLYSLRAVVTLILLFLSTAALSSFLLEGFIFIKNNFKTGGKAFFYTFLFACTALLLAFLFLDKQVIGYIVVLSLIVTFIGVYRSND